VHCRGLGKPTGFPTGTGSGSGYQNPDLAGTCACDGLPVTSWVIQYDLLLQAFNNGNNNKQDQGQVLVPIYICLQALANRFLGHVDNVSNDYLSLLTALSMCPTTLASSHLILSYIRKFPRARHVQIDIIIAYNPDL
jgi:hypothetical protein